MIKTSGREQDLKERIIRLSRENVYLLGVHGMVCKGTENIGERKREEEGRERRKRER